MHIDLSCVECVLMLVTEYSVNDNNYNSLVCCVLCYSNIIFGMQIIKMKLMTVISSERWFSKGNKSPTITDSCPIKCGTMNRCRYSIYDNNDITISAIGYGIVSFLVCFICILRVQKNTYTKMIFDSDNEIMYST